jgi:hypothetical protein
MPVLVESAEVKLERNDLLQRAKLAPLGSPNQRSSGVHLSGVLRYIAQTSKLISALARIDEEELPLRWALGLAWEEFCVSLYPGAVWQPGEVEVEGVYMTCDALNCIPLRVAPPDFNQPQLVVEEFKFTWKKRQTTAEFLDDWMWMQQGRGYCMGYQTNFVRYHVCYVNGDYRGMSPLYVRHLVEFHPEEIRKTWTMVMANKDKAIAEVH